MNYLYLQNVSVQNYEVKTLVGTQLFALTTMDNVFIKNVTATSSRGPVLYLNNIVSTQLFDCRFDKTLVSKEWDSRLQCVVSVVNDGSKSLSAQGLDPNLAINILMQNLTVNVK